MEGNLYQLTKSRKGRPLAAGLIANLFKQILLGLDHIHASGYFHRDMKPENLLITTTGLADYPPFLPPHPSSASQQSTRGPEKDVVAIVKIADFGLARETKSKPPYTEYVSTRWYRAPEVLLRSRDYSYPVDMWAIGTILTEMINLKPLFPGQSEVDQVFRICEVMGNPSDEYGFDSRGRMRGGGPWDRGIKMAKSVGFQFPKIQPIRFETLFDPNQVPYQLVDLIADLMRYDPKNRPTTQQCLHHDYFKQVTPYLLPILTPAQPMHRLPQQQPSPSQQGQHAAQKVPVSISVPSSAGSYAQLQPNQHLPSSPRDLPPSHAYSSQSRIQQPPFDPRYNSQNGVPGLPPPQSSASSTYSNQQHADYQSLRAAQPSALSSNDSHGLGRLAIRVDQRGQMVSPTSSYPESVDVTMDGDETSQPSRKSNDISPVPSSVYSFGQGDAHQLPQPSHQLPPPHPPHLPHHLQHSHYSQLRQGPNGYAPSNYSVSHYNPSILSGHSGGRRGSAGGASTFYDGSIFEGIAPTRAASILSFPADYGAAPPSPTFNRPNAYPALQYNTQSSQAANAYLANLRRTRQEPDNYSVDFEREAIQRSQNQSQSNVSLATTDSQESLKAGAGGKAKSVRGWMSVFNNSDGHKQPVQPHPQQQPLIHPAGFPASSSASIHSSHPSNASVHGGSSLKRSPSERSQYAPDPPSAAAPAQSSSAPLDPKKAKKEAEKAAKEAEKLKREMAQKAARDRARAVMQKRNALAQAADPLHSLGQHQTSTNSPAGSKAPVMSDKEKQARERALLEAAQRKQLALMAQAGKLPQIAEDGRCVLAAPPFAKALYL